MNDLRFKCRASSLGNLMTKSPNTESVKKVLLDTVLFEGFGWRKQLDVKMIKKGNALECQAIELISRMNFVGLTKNTERLENDWFTGECDVTNDDTVRDTKVSWSIGTFPWTESDAKALVKSSGYDWQGLAYCMLWGKSEHWVDFVLLPTPENILGFGDDPYEHIDMVNQIPIEKRVRSVKVSYSDELILQAQERVELLQDRYNELYRNIVGDKYD